MKKAITLLLSSMIIATTASADEFSSKVLANMTGKFTLTSGSTKCRKGIISEYYTEGPNYKSIQIKSANDTDYMFIGANFFPHEVSSPTKLYACSLGDDAGVRDCRNGEKPQGRIRIRMETLFEKLSDGTYHFYAHYLSPGDELDQKLDCLYKKSK